MLTHDLQITTHKDGPVTYRVSINAAWVTIKRSSDVVGGAEVVYKREANKGIWYDASHQKIVRAIHQLEEALLDGIECEEKKKVTQWP